MFFSVKSSSKLLNLLVRITLTFSFAYIHLGSTVVVITNLLLLWKLCSIIWAVKKRVNASEM